MAPGGLKLPAVHGIFTHQIRDFCCLFIVSPVVHNLFLAFSAKLVYFIETVNTLYGKATGGFSMSNNRKALRERKQELHALHSQLYDLRSTLDELYAQFDRLTDSSQVEACIYEMNAVMARYDYTLKCLKAFELS